MRAPATTIINLAPTGMIPTKAMNPAVPVTPDEIVADVRECAPLGASIVHLHARGSDGSPTHEAAVFAEAIAGIRATNPELVITVTTSGRTYQGFDERAAALRLTGDVRPDMASLTLGSVNFNRSASISSPDTIMRLAEEMHALGVKPELEVFDVGMVNFAHYLIKKELLEPPYYFNVLLGNISAAQARLTHLGLIVSELPEDSVVCVAGIGDAQLDMNALGVVMCDGARVGLEDMVWFDRERTVPATNAMLVERVAGIARALGRTIATPEQVRAMLGLPAV